MLGAVSLEFAAASLEDRGALAAAFPGLGILSVAPPVSPEDLDDARRLQTAVVRCALAAAACEPLPARDVETINSYAGDEPPLLALRADGSAGRTAADPVRAALAAIARDAVETISRHAGALRTCASDGCERSFLDLSRGQRRRWCSMTRCGNRVKVMAFRQRSRNPRATSSRGF